MVPRHMKMSNVVRTTVQVRILVLEVLVHLNERPPTLLLSTNLTYLKICTVKIEQICIVIVLLVHKRFAVGTTR